MAELTPLGAFFEKLREKGSTLLIAMYAILAVLVALNFIWTPHHPHFGLDKYTGFWAGFGLLFGLGMVIVMKKIVQPFIARDEEFYDSGD
ncbi:hypothetical protein SAMN02745704_01779 [Paucidesulfovibrio gracilis DSM 16080]|uniref:Uncharacterized protein n=1 Tax=Paucidesulfovibrio gracilis DSM 16080 TaxID=1121449 RepID=A0A1T4X6Q4_9BACT|nr:hypothetical protein [Paucidesulfovibrio gracilis]SKA84551.1 hypothetical protein SAMN02745704_01779 [Paucidesulfovibrio gracilis DSM 16080]